MTWTRSMHGVDGEFTVQTWLQQWPDGLIGLDESHRIRFLSAQAENLLGWGLEHTLDRTVHELLCVQSRDFAHSVEHCPLCVAHADPSRITSYFWRRRDGHNISVDCRKMAFAGGSQLSHVLSFQSNEGRAHNWQEIEKLLAYVECNPSPVAEFDMNGQVLFGNVAFQKWLLHADFDDNGQSRLLPANLKALCRSCLSSGAKSDAHEVNFEDQWISWHFAPLVCTQGQVVIGHAFDISERKRFELQNEHDKAVARRTFYAKMIHELRTPLNAIIGFSQVLLKRLEQQVGEGDLANLAAIRTAGMQLNQMISNTLESSKIEAGKMKVECAEFDLRDMLASVSEQLESLAEAKGLSYQVRCESGLRMHSDGDKVRQIVVNLVANALKYTLQGEISTVVDVDYDRRAVVFSIIDTGVGIAQNQLAELFTAFSRVGDSKTQRIQGTGLGLALVADLVQILGGEISVESELDKGSCFTVVLPLVSSDAQV